jgi:hypothetical protein
VAKVYPEIREIRGFIWDKNGVVWDKLGVILDNVGVILDNVGVRNVTHWNPKNRIYEP